MVCSLLHPAVPYCFLAAAAALVPGIQLASSRFATFKGLQTGMVFRIRLTRNWWKDLLRFAVAAGILLVSLATFWNHGPLHFDFVEEGYRGLFMEGRQLNKTLNQEGTVVFMRWIEQKTKPSLNPITIIWQHYLNKQHAGNYELIFGILAQDTAAVRREYAIYQTGSNVYLRVEPVGVDRVLIADFTPGELEEALRPYIVE